MIDEREIYNVEDFLSFLYELHKDFLDNQIEWQNVSAGEYIESIHHWLKDSQFLFEKNQLSFNDLKEIFISGKYYE